MDSLFNIIQYKKVEAFRHPSIIFGYQLGSNIIIWHFSAFLGSSFFFNFFLHFEKMMMSSNFNSLSSLIVFL